MKQKNLIISLIFLIAVIVIGAFLYKPATETTPSAPPVDDSGATAEGIDSVIEANNQLALELYNQFKDEEENIFFSPYSISTALAMTYEGARGQTAQEMQSVFHFPEEDSVRRPAMAAVYNQINQEDSKYQLNTANALWAQEDYPFLNEYINLIDQYYGGRATNLDFIREAEKSRKTINDRVAQQTKDKILDLIPAGVLNELTRLVLTNAIYFKGQWLTQFDEKDTQEEDFRVGPEKTIKIPMMSLTNGETEFDYLETEELQILEMPYNGEELSMLVLLPKEDDLAALEESLNLDNLNQWREMLNQQPVNVFMPKFTFETKYFLKQDLQEMGMPTAFSMQADFSGMDGTKDLFISKVIHQAFVEVNEEGTEAAAATAVVIELKSVGPSVAVFRADHPFIFLIQDSQSGNILFLGRVNNPS
jgi:serpin B